MVKKLLIMMLVLGMVSVANAEIMFLVGGLDPGNSINLAPDATVTIQVSDDVASQNGYIAYFYVDWGQPGSLTNGAATPNAGSAADVSPYTETGVGIGYIMTCMSISDDISPGIQFTADFDATGLIVGQTSSLTIYDSRLGYGTADTLGINIIPEPMTIALLGVGGLFLRRRKSK